MGKIRPTITEVMALIVIILVLSGIVIPNFGEKVTSFYDNIFVSDASGTTPSDLVRLQKATDELENKIFVLENRIKEYRKKK